MKSFIHHIGEAASIPPIADSRWAIDIIDFVTKPPYNFVHSLSLSNKYNVRLHRKLFYPRDAEVNYLYVNIVYNHFYVEIPVPNINEKLISISYGSITDKSISYIENLNPEIDKLQIRFNSVPNETSMQNAYTNVYEQTTLRSFDERRRANFVFYNTYIDTPGTEAEKTIEALKRIGISRPILLRAMEKYGLLKDMDLSFKDYADLV